MSINNDSEKKPLLLTTNKQQQKDTTTTTTSTGASNQNKIVVQQQLTKEEKTQQTYDTLHYPIDEKCFHILESNKLNCHGCRPSRDTYCRRVRQCPRCDGRGDTYYIKGDRYTGTNEIFSTVTICPICNGVGRVRCVFCVICKFCKNKGCHLCHEKTGFNNNYIPSLYN